MAADWISTRDQLPDEGQPVEISILANSPAISLGKRLGEKWFVERKFGGSLLMGEPSAPAYWRPLRKKAA